MIQFMTSYGSFINFLLYDLNIFDMGLSKVQNVSK